jgi:hypothetical protein
MMDNNNNSHIAYKRVQVGLKKYQSHKLQVEETMKKILQRSSGSLAIMHAALRMSLYLI